MIIRYYQKWLLAYQKYCRRAPLGKFIKVDTSYVLNFQSILEHRLEVNSVHNYHWSVEFLQLEYDPVLVLLTSRAGTPSSCSQRNLFSFIPIQSYNFLPFSILKRISSVPHRDSIYFQHRYLDVLFPTNYFIYRSSVRDRYRCSKQVKLFPAVTLMNK